MARSLHGRFVVWYSGQAGVVKQLSATPQGSPAGVTPFSHSALSWVTFPEDSTAMFKLWCFVNWGSQASMISVLFLQPRAQLQFSTSFCVPHLEGVKDALDVSPLVPHFIREMSLQLGASYSSPRQSHLSGIRDVSKAPAPLSVLTCHSELVLISEVCLSLRLQWPALDRFEVSLTSSFSHWGSTLSSLGSGAFFAASLFPVL